ncbi:MAG: hypothetical protein O3B29_06635 [Proteobacteria bacterium]|nr:hypothetical protein [Pseudomonadota bacterium]
MSIKRGHVKVASWIRNYSSSLLLGDFLAVVPSFYMPEKVGGQLTPLLTSEEMLLAM